jgi:type IV secretion system protein VirD4
MEWVVITALSLFVALLFDNARKNAARAQRVRLAYKGLRTFSPASPGSARFADNDDLRKAGLFKKKGVAIGYSPDGRHALHYPGKGHLLTVAGARKGKGATLIINALLQWRQSVLVIDPKAEISAVVGHWRRRFGSVFVINPFGMLPDALKGLKQARYNPMDILDPALPSFHADCDKLAGAVVWDEGNGDGKYFTSAARVLVSGVIAALARHAAPDKKNLVEVAQVVSSGDVFTFCQNAMQSPDPFIISKLGRFAKPDAEKSREVCDVVATASNGVAFINNAAIAESLRASDFRFSDLKRKPGTTVAICLPLNKLDVCDKYFRLLLECFLSELLNEGQRGKGKRTLAVVDECGQLGPNLKSLENALGMAAGACGLQLWLIYQSLSQILGMWPNTWQNVIQNCGVTTWFGVADSETREQVSKLAGTCDVAVPSRSLSLDHMTGEPHESESSGIHTKPLLAPHELGMIAPDEMIAFVEGVRCGPVKAKRKFYFKCWGLRGYRDNPYPSE